MSRSVQRKANLLPEKDEAARPKDLDDGRAVREEAERIRDWNGESVRPVPMRGPR